MKIETIYLCGKITGLPTIEYTEKFRRKALEIESAMFDVFNPVAEVPLRLDKHFCPEKIVWKEAMQVCIEELIYCDGVFAMPCHVESKGATLELQIAKAMNIPIFYTIDELIKHKF